MYRKNKKKISGNLNLDSLMDILTCTVGLMLFIVTFAMLEAQGVRFKMTTPIVQDAPDYSNRKFFICSDSTIRFLDLEHAVNELFGDWKLTYRNVPSVVKSANEKQVADRYFTYRLDYNEWTRENDKGDLTRSRSISLIIDKRSDAAGETIGEIRQADSYFMMQLKKFNPEKAWVVFSVDGKSLEIFRAARQLCQEREIETGWDPGKIEFPYREVIVGENQNKKDIFHPRAAWSRPQG
jgi:hypothetical protein